MSTPVAVATTASLSKAPTGIVGLDEITHGGLPRGRPTLVAGAAGSGKTLFGIEFLVRGATEHQEPGVLLCFEEDAGDLAANVASLGFDLEDLRQRGLLVIDSFQLDPADFLEAGQFDLEGLFVRLQLAVDAVGAKRVVLDTVEVLLATLPDPAVVRSELGRLFRWLKQRDLTAVITGEREADLDGTRGRLTRAGIEEFVSDCVVVLDHRVQDSISTRHLRVAKYRGSLHGTSEYPFLITERGFVVVPLTSVGLEYDASEERVSSGIPDLDEMLGGGVFRGSSVLISGAAGTGKTSIGVTMAAAACEAGERALLLSFEESPRQLIRNMRSIGVDLERWVEAGLLRVHSVRATAHGLEEHLAELHRLVEEHDPALVVLDAVVSLAARVSQTEVASVLSRDLDLLKSRGVTAVMTTLVSNDVAETSEVEVSSLVDTWLLLRNQESNGERNRLVYVIKSRGTAHSHQVREFVLGSEGPQLVDVYVTDGVVLTGSARVEHQAIEQRAKAGREAERQRRRAALKQRTTSIEAQIAALQVDLRAEQDEYERLVGESEDPEERGARRGSSARHGTDGSVR